MTSPMRIVEFASIVYPATDLARSRAFYEDVLGLISTTCVNDGDQFWVEYEIGPHTLGIGNEPFLKPSGDGPHLALEVDDFDKTIGISDVTKCRSPLRLSKCPAAGRRLSWIPTVTNSAFINERPCAAAKPRHFALLPIDAPRGRRRTWVFVREI